MPWKGEREPYRIWLSEIILQQTRVEQGLQYYQRFVTSFPEVRDLASAPEQQVFKLWEGLGYYSRCRNLIATAKLICEKFDGHFPKTYEDILKLKGVGPYTAAAISSFAFNLPHAVVDGNVYRVLSRIYGVSTPIDSTEGKKQFRELAEKLLDKKEPAQYNQAIMDFGATICTPSPKCEACPFAVQCIAFNTNAIGLLPVKSKKIKIRKRFFHYLVIQNGNKIAIQQRTAKDIWNQLFEFPLIENADLLSHEDVLAAAIQNGWLTAQEEVLNYSDVYTQQLSHQLIRARFLRVISSGPLRNGNGLQWCEESELQDFPFPKIINAYLEGARSEVNGFG